MKSTILVLFSFLVSISFVRAKGPVDNVNPFIGTGGHGHTFPGATVPFGMVQLSPDTRTLGWDACSGYHYSDSSILGFSHTHLSGTGIGDYGDVLFMPFSGKANINPGSPEVPGSGYRSRFSHKDEKAWPGYYSVKLLDYDILAELTATQRAGFHRYTFSKGGNSGVIIDLSHTIHGHQNPVNQLHVISDTEIEGLKQTRGWATNHYVYFYAKFSKPFSCKLYSANVEAKGDKEITSTNGKAVLTFDLKPGEQVLVKVGISPVDLAGARNNLEKEITGWQFDKVASNAKKSWEEQLQKIQIEGGSENDRTIFYTALYHTSISPNIFNDADGRYRGMDGKIHQANGFTNYTVFSLWDTFRAFHPLFTLIDPDRDCEFIKALLSKYDEGGILPKWELAANYTGTMIGYHAVPVIVDAYMKNIQGFDVQKAYKAMIASSVYDTAGILFPGREVKDKLMPLDRYYNEKYGYIPSNLANKAVSEGLEYAYDDWCIAQMAKELKDSVTYRKYMSRSMNYKNYFDAGTGFMRGKNSDGTWRTPFNPRHSNHENADYVEGNAWQWTWFVPHDVDGYVRLMGGKNKFINKLDSLFSVDSQIDGTESSPDISGMIGQYAHGNEPSHHIIYFYNYLGQPWKTQQLADSILHSLYFNDPDGLSGNEDCGQMSAWYILSAMGIYSFCPGNPEYSIGRPLFDKVTIQLANKKTFTISAPHNSLKNKFIQSITLNGKKINTPFINHSDILKGGEITLTMGAAPDYHFGAD